MRGAARGRQVVVTGGAGYVGAPLVAALLRHGLRVRVIDNLMYGVHALMPLIQNPRLEIVRADIRNPLRRYLRDAEVVFHLAAISGYAACADNPHAARAVNVAATRQLTRSLSRRQLLVYASTTSFYGDRPGVTDETTPPRPVSLYGATKYQAEQIVMDHPASIALRFATLFGVGPRLRVDLLVNDFVRRAVHERYIALYEAGTKRTFLHVRDAVHGYLLALERSDRMLNTVYNVGSERLNFTKLEVARAVQRVTGCEVGKVQVPDFDVRNFVTSFARVRRLGYKPRVSLRRGIEELARLYAVYQPYPTFHTL